MPLFIASLLFAPLLFLVLYIGTLWPLDLCTFLTLGVTQTQTVWVLFLLAYAFIASVAPIGMLLQPRDYLNSFLLYGMVIIGILSIGITATPLKLPVFEGFLVQNPLSHPPLWNLFPILFVTVACGACSGFHALVASGTTSKQIESKKHLLPIGYGAMLLEGVVALIALISVASLSSEEYVFSITKNGPVNTFAYGLASLTTHIGLPADAGLTFLSLTISAFMLTTLDTAVRLTRFIVQEFCLPRSKGNRREIKHLSSVLSNRYAATTIVIMCSACLALSGEALSIWPMGGPPINFWPH